MAGIAESLTRSNCPIKTKSHMRGKRLLRTQTLSSTPPNTRFRSTQSLGGERKYSERSSTTHRRASTQAAACGWCTHKSLYPLHALSAPLHHLLSVDFSIPFEPSFYQLDLSFWKPAKTRRQEAFFKSPRPHSGGHVRLATALARGADLARAAPDGTTALHAAAQVSSSRRVSS